MKFPRILFITLIWVISGCSLESVQEDITPIIVVVPSVTPQPIQDPAQEMLTSASLPGGLEDMLPVMSGVCFEAAWDAAGQIFILRSAEDHIRLYDLADHSRLCRRAVRRYPFDFSDGATLVGLWSRGVGCVARHEITQYDRNDSGHIITMELQLIVDGDCPYELVRPFWVKIPASQSYEIHVELVTDN